MKPDYSVITETPGQKATKEQLERLFHRYHFAKRFVNGKIFLEVGCGSGLGLGYLAEHSKRAIGADIDGKNLEIARELCAGNDKIEILALDAHELPFEDNSLDPIFLFEAIYYLERPEQFISEAYRVLEDNGHMILCTVNKDWKDFHPSKYSFRYFSVPELNRILTDAFSDVKFYGAFDVESGGIKARTLSILKRTASKLDLIPGSLKLRAYLKRVFIGKLLPIPNTVYEGMAKYVEPVELENDKSTEQYKIIYAVAIK